MKNEELFDTIEQVEEFIAINDFLEDKEVERALNAILNFIKKPDVPKDKVGEVVTKLQALSALFQMKAAVYKTIQQNRAGTPENHKKNLYMSLYDAMDKLVAALKYISRQDVG